MQKENLFKIKTPIHMDELMPFHKESMSRIKELLCERSTQLANNKEILFPSWDKESN